MTNIFGFSLQLSRVSLNWCVIDYCTAVNTGTSLFHVCYLGTVLYMLVLPAPILTWHFLLLSVANLLHKLDKADVKKCRHAWCRYMCGRPTVFHVR